MRKRRSPLLRTSFVKLIEDDDISYEDLEELLEDVHFRKPNNHRGCTGDCWIRGNDSLVYTQTEVNGELRLAHRVSYEIFTGKKLKYYACHHCDTPACINPEHIYDGTAWQNIRDARLENVARQTGIKDPKLKKRKSIRRLKREYRRRLIDEAKYKSMMSRKLENLIPLSPISKPTDDVLSLISKLRKLTGVI